MITCRIEKSGRELFRSEKRGISPLIDIIDGGLDVSGAAAYDTIVGKAAAMLYVKLRVASVTAGVMTATARDILTGSGIACACETLTDAIVNRRGDGPCPMERAVADISSPDDAYAAIKNTLKIMAITQ